MSAQVMRLQRPASRLDELEQVVERDQRSFVEAGKALRAIRDERLYDAAFGTFEAYCRARFGMQRRHAYRLIDAAAVVDRVCPIGHTQQVTESVVRPLTKLEPDAQLKVWSEATDRWLKPTAAQVAAVVAELFPKPKPVVKPAEQTGPSSTLVVVLDDLEQTAKALSSGMDLAKLEALYAYLGERIAKKRAARGMTVP
jgi:hypothetical protein